MLLFYSFLSQQRFYNAYQDYENMRKDLSMYFLVSKYIIPYTQSDSISFHHHTIYITLILKEFPSTPFQQRSKFAHERANNFITLDNEGARVPCLETGRDPPHLINELASWALNVGRGGGSGRDKRRADALISSHRTRVCTCDWRRLYYFSDARKRAWSLEVVGEVGGMVNALEYWRQRVRKPSRGSRRYNIYGVARASERFPSARVRLVARSRSEQVLAGSEWWRSRRLPRDEAGTSVKN